MRTQSIFDGGFITYPTIFKKSKPVFNETSIVNKSFCLGPDRLKNGSVTNLKNNLGIVVGGIPTLKTSFFSGKNNLKFFPNYIVGIKKHFHFQIAVIGNFITYFLVRKNRFNIKLLQ